MTMPKQGTGIPLLPAFAGIVMLAAGGLLYPRIAALVDALGTHRIIIGPVLQALGVAALLTAALMLLHRFAEPRPAEEWRALRPLQALAAGLALGLMAVSAIALDVHGLKDFVLRTGMFALLCGGLLRGGLHLPSRGITAALAAWFGAQLISALAAEQVRPALLRVYDQALLAGCFLAVAGMLLETPRARGYLTGWLGLVSAAAACYGLLQAAGLDPVAWHDLAVFATGTYVLTQPGSFLSNPNFAAALCLIGLACSLAAAAALRARRGRILYTGCALLNFACLVLTLSRSGWLTALLLLTAVTAVAASRGMLRPLLQRYRWPLLVAACCLVALAAWQGRHLADRLGSAFTNQRSFSSRVHLYTAAWDLFRAKPLFGWGPDNYQFVFDRVIAPDFFRLYPPSTSVILIAHNEYLQQLAETGVAGSVAFALFVMLVLRTAVGRLRERPDPLRYGQLAALAALLLQGAFDMHLRYLTFQALCWLLLALVYAAPRAVTRHAAPAAPRLFATGAALCGGCAALFFFAQPFVAGTLARGGRHLAGRNMPAAAEPLLRDALMLDPANLVALNELGLLCYRSGRTGEARQVIDRIRSRSAYFCNPEFKYALIALAEQRYPDAHRHIQEARRVEPSGIVLLYAAQLEISAGNFVQAEADLRSAAAQDTAVTASFDWSLAMAIVAQQTGRQAEALACVARARTINPAHPELLRRFGGDTVPAAHE